MQEGKAWQRLKELGSGGQSIVYLVRSPQRVAELIEASNAIAGALNHTGRQDDFVNALSEKLRSDRPDELGALKLFNKVREGDAAPELRIRREIEILREAHPGLPKLLDSNADEKWMITEYFSRGTLEHSPSLCKGDPETGLRTFRGLVATVAYLHERGIIHRDIKPPNIFIAENGDLIPGDFGIAHREDAGERLTATKERVGPRDYMPQWADMGERFDEIKPSFDVYMLGKLLWCMISGKLRLPREYHRRPEFDLAKQFPADKRMLAINGVLDRCLVEDESACLKSGKELLDIVDDAIASFASGFVTNDNGQLELTCLACGRGVYLDETPNGGRTSLHIYNRDTVQVGHILARVFSCNVCGHKALFAPDFPEKGLIRKP